MNGAALVKELKRKLSIKTDRALAKHLGMTEIALGGWKRSEKPLTPRQMANAVQKASEVAVVKAQSSTLRPIVEFFPIDVVEVGKKGRNEVFPCGRNAGQHYSGLHAELLRVKGLYIFYDTRGKALYAGQTQKQSIWKEMNDAFNRKRSPQLVTLVNHPTNDVQFKAASEKVRQPTSINLRLHELAAYFSVYEVSDGMIDELEALLVRAFPNDLLNYKMDKFGKSANNKVRTKRVTAVRRVK